jgi:sigma-E factor negative regulatory protein RseA
MDGELESHACGAQLERLCKDRDLAKRWDQYHLIRDVLRGEGGTRVDLVSSVHVRLQAEPTVLAPRRLQDRVMARVAWPAAAAIAAVFVAGVFVGGRFAGPSPSGSPGIAQISTAPNTAVTAGSITTASHTGSSAVNVEPADGQVAELIVAHTEYSPTTAMQGAASYARTFQLRGSVNAQ